LTSARAARASPLHAAHRPSAALTTSATMPFDLVVRLDRPPRARRVRARPRPRSRTRVGFHARRISRCLLGTTSAVRRGDVSTDAPRRGTANAVALRASRRTRDDADDTASRPREVFSARVVFLVPGRVFPTERHTSDAFFRSIRFPPMHRTADSSPTSPTSGATAATGTTTGSRSTSTRALL
jgi:hypothetical protein